MRVQIFTDHINTYDQLKNIKLTKNCFMEGTVKIDKLSFPGEI